MKGFFNVKETESKSRPGGKVTSCASCGLYKKARHPKMEPVGNFKKGILIIGENPTQREDSNGKPFSDTKLELHLKNLDIDLFKDCLSIYAVSCYCSGWKIEPDQIVNCRRFVLKTISDTQPKLIILLGSVAVNSVIGHRWKRDLGDIQKWRGWQIPDQDFKAWVCPIFDLKYVEKSEKEVSTIFKADLASAIALVEKDFRRYKKPEIRYLKSLEELNSIKDKTSCAFDYEATGLKPHAKGHRIVAASIAVSSDLVYTFEIPKTRKGRKPFIDFLKNQLIPKRAHNMKYEEAWSTVRLRQPVQNWEWDSMLAAHLLDNRSGVTGLKFQTYVQFGVIDYSSEVSPYLSSGTKDGNAKNTIQEYMSTPEGIRKILEYCALDSIFEYRLSELQMEILGFEDSYPDLPF